MDNPRGRGRNQRGRGIRTWRARGGIQSRRGGQFGLGENVVRNPPRFPNDGNVRRGRGNRGHTGYRRDTPYIQRPIGYKKLESIQLNDSPRDIVLFLSTNRSGLEERLSENDEKMGDGMIQMVLKVLGKMSESDGPTEAMGHVLELILKHNFDTNMNLFLHEQITNGSRDGIEIHIENSLKLCEKMLTVVPKSSEKKVSMSLLVIKAVIDCFGNLPLSTRERFEQVKALLDDVKTESKTVKTSRREGRKNALEDLHAVDAPDDFRQISVFPELTDIVGAREAFIRVNLIGRAYRSVDHYLDVQFRLLREDFVRPLREGITEITQFREDTKGRPVYQNVKVYTDVRIEFMIPTQRGIFHRIHFDTEYLQFIRWRNTKRLLYGNLLCLSSDKFKNHVLFAVVVDRKPEELEYGCLTVEFVQEDVEVEDESDEEDDEFDVLLFERRRRAEQGPATIDLTKTYTMVETDAYFEAYRHVLAGLKETEELPLERYIVFCNQEMHAPEYLRPSVAGRTVYYNLSALAKTRSREVNVLDERDWPSAEELSLDQSQAAALKLALTKELAIIQGPPGTGKTHVGLAIMNVLLKNKSKWNARHNRLRLYLPAEEIKEADQGPILVVCYTNHALDQFLEGISKFCTRENGIVRVGGRCKNEELKQFSLAEIRRKRRNIRGSEKKATLRRNAVWDLNREIGDMESDLQRKSNLLEASLRCIQKFKELEPEIPWQLASQLKSFDITQRGRRSEDVPLLEWLGLGMAPNAPEQVPNVNLSHMTLNMLTGLGYTSEQIVHAHVISGFQTVHQLLLLLRDPRMAHMFEGAVGGMGMWQDPNQYGAYEGNPGEDGEFQEEADLIQEQRMLDEEEMFSLMTRKHKTNREKDNEVKLMMNKMAAMTFEDINERKQPNEKDEGAWQMTKGDKKKNKRNIKKELGKTDQMSDAEEAKIRNIHELKTSDRWRLYRTWVNRWRNKHRLISQHIVTKYNKLAKRREELRREEDDEIIQEADVVAVTTTGAAKYRDLIYKLNSRIVVVEEAAEVLEAHIITSMPKKTQHLILIGDHQQLKPSPTVYELAKKYKLDTSLFERLVKTDIPHVTLNLQHRMRPSIADLIRPRIYKHLSDHESVLDRDPVTGIQKSLFFVTHDVKEESIQDGRSKQNQHEVDFLVGLCKYILMQGYQPEQITVLVMYTGQLFAFRGAMKEKLSRGIRVTAVDNFQGEENDIILLSLVRSNDEGKIGFLSIENRICVALSRAKNALYCIGNMEMLASKSSMWRQIVSHLEENDSIGEELMLQCKNHPEKLAGVQCGKDFAKVPEGGCGQPCRTRLDCGHVCVRLCHPDDHSKVLCQRPCSKILCDRGHKCKEKCHICRSNGMCKNCRTPVEKIIPKCGHKQKVPCFQPEDEFRCLEMVRAELRCGHEGEVACYTKHDPKSAVCKEKCSEYLECEHLCPGNCSECFEGRLHVPCKSKCGRPLVCGHSCNTPCSEFCPPCMQKCETRCEHSKCAESCGKPCVLCREKCAWKCEHYQCSMLCSEPCDRPPCNIACRKRLKCTHQCIGLCGEKCPTKCRICNEKEVTDIFFGDEDEPDARFVQLVDCNHLFEYKALDKFMEHAEDASEGIKMLKCPKCSTPIRRSRRYGRIINKILNSINDVKKKIYGVASDYAPIQRILKAEFEKEEKLGQTYPRDMIELRDAIKEKQSMPSLSVLENRFRRLKKLADLREKARKVMFTNDVGSSRLIQDLLGDINKMSQWVKKRRSRCIGRESICFTRETERIDEALRYIDVESTQKNGTLSFGADVLNIMEKLKELLFTDVDAFDDHKKKRVEERFGFLRRRGLIPNLAITEEEKEMICKAMDFASKGHWYKCPNGHVYSIGECGGATQESTCPECKEQIGGTSHRLLETNRIASEMDGATRPAYDPANLYIPPEFL